MKANTTTMMWAGPLPPGAIADEKRREPMIWAGPLPPGDEESRRYTPHPITAHHGLRRPHAA